MAEEMKDLNPHLFNLITMFASSAWCQLGKMQNPMNGKIEKDLPGAKMTIDMLVMLRDKMKGNLTKKEEEIVASTISNLQINYADEASKPADKQSEKIENKESEGHSHDCGCCHDGCEGEGNENFNLDRRDFEKLHK